MAFILFFSLILKKHPTGQSKGQLGEMQRVRKFDKSAHKHFNSESLLPINE
jgi:hypothetical protein